LYFNVIKNLDIDPSSLNDPIFLIGWPGISLVGKLAITSIRDSIKAEKCLTIEYFDFPAKSIVNKGNLKIPKARVYYRSREPNDLFILTAKFQPQNPEGVFDFAKQFCDYMHKITEGKISMYVSAGALVSEKIEDEPLVHVCGTDAELVTSFLEYEHSQIMENGVIAGANGILPTWAGEKGFAPGICLLAETLPPLPMMNIDPRASKALVNILKDYLKIDMNFDELDKKIEEMEEAFEAFRKQADYIMKGGRPDKGTDSYFR